MVQRWSDSQWTQTTHQHVSREIEFKGGGGCELGKPYERLKRLRTLMRDETRPTGMDVCEDTRDSWCIDTRCDNGSYTFSDD